MIFLKLFFGLFFPYCMGYAALRLVLGRSYRLNLLFVPPISFGLGLGILANGMLILDMLGIPFTLLNVSLMQLVLLAGLIALGGKKAKSKDVTVLLSFSPEQEKEGVSFLIKCLYALFLGMAGYYLYFIFWRALSIPLYEWDSLATSIYMAKIFYIDGDLSKLKWAPYAIYPLQQPLVCVWISLCLGWWEEQYVKILFPLIFLAFMTIYYGVLRYWVSRAWAVLGLMFLFSSNIWVYHATLSYRDLFLAYYTCTAVLLLVLWFEKKHIPFLLLAGIMTGLGTFTKLEGVLYMVVLLALTGCLVGVDTTCGLARKLKTYLFFGVPCTGIFLLYYVYKMSHGISTVDYIDPQYLDSLTKFKRSLSRFSEVVFLTANWNIFWGWLIVSLLFNVRIVAFHKNIQILLSAVFLFLAAHFTLSLLLGISSNMLAPVTMPRLILHFFPLVPLLIILINSEVYKKRQ